MKEVLVVIFVIIAYLAIILAPSRFKKHWVAASAAIIGILCTLIPIEKVKTVILTDHPSPWKIMVFLLSFAVISTTLDDAGFFRWAAVRITEKSNHNAKRLFFLLFVLTATITFFTSNDIVILTLTPLILHIGLHHDRHPRAYLYMMFFVANTGSLGHILGNLTNLIVGDAFGISLLASAYILVPILAVAITIQYYILRYYFSNELQKPFQIMGHFPAHRLISNPRAAGVGLTMLAIVLGLACIAPWFSFPLWLITSVGALITIVVAKENPWRRLQRLPWSVALLLTSLLILLTGLISTGVIDVLGTIISSHIPLTPIGLALISPFATSIIAALMNNIPGTLFMTSILQHSAITGTSNTILQYAIIIGSNLGANLAIMGSLAGFMWLDLIHKKGYNIRWRDFSKVGIITTLPIILIASVLLALQLR